LKIYFGPAVGRSYEIDSLNCVLKLLAGGDVLFRPQCNDALVSRSRSIAASQFLKSDADVLLIIDTDIVFLAEDARRLCAEALKMQRPMVGLYSSRSDGDKKMPTSCLLRGQTICSEDATPTLIRWGATGFMAIPRAPLVRLARDLPLCHADREWAFRPFFMPFVADNDDGEPIYLSEDYAFCERAAQVGFPTYCLPDIKLLHIGPYPYSLGEGHYKLERKDEPGVKYRWYAREPLPA
jgi:hypothetical protein